MRSPLAEDIFREADEAAIATANGLANYAQGTISNICTSKFASRRAKKSFGRKNAIMTSLRHYVITS